jgi:hypothetical protein
MHLFIEESFLIDFEIEFDKENPTIGQKCLNSIFTEYTGIRIYFNELTLINSFGSRYFNLITNHNSLVFEIGDFERYFESCNELPNQSLVLSGSKLKSSEKVKKMGALQFDYLTYELKIREIIDKVHFKLSFSDSLEQFSWNHLSCLDLLPIKTIVIDDPYILTNQKGQMLKDNLIPMVKSLMTGQLTKSSLTIFADQIKNKIDLGKDEIDRVRDRFVFVQKELIQTVSSLTLVKSKLKQDMYEQHDRYVYTPFCVISVGKGFNLFPLRINNSKIEIITIFDKFSYQLMQSHNLHLKQMSEKLHKLDVIESQLKVYPINNKVKLFID